MATTKSLTCFACWSPVASPLDLPATIPAGELHAGEKICEGCAEIQFSMPAERMKPWNDRKREGLLGQVQDEIDS